MTKTLLPKIMAVRTLFAALAFLLAVPFAAHADHAVGTRVPSGTAPGQTLVWNAAGWTIAPIVYNGNNLTLPAPYTLGVGGQSDGSAVYVAPNAPAQNGLTVKMPAASSGWALQILTNTGTQVLRINSFGLVDFLNGASFFGSVNNYSGSRWKAPNGAGAGFGLNDGQSITGTYGTTGGFTFTAMPAVAASAIEFAQNSVMQIKQSGTASYTGIGLNITETTLGTGAHKLMDLQVGGVSKLQVDTTGLVNAAGGYSVNDRAGATQDVTVTSGTTTVLHFKGGLFVGVN